MRPLVLTRAAGVIVTALTSAATSGCGAATPSPPPLVDRPVVTAEPVASPQAIAALDDGERRIEVAAGDCAAACAGLTTMTRARIELCSPRTSACENAERREGDARRNVAAFCDPCPPR